MEKQPHHYTAREANQSQIHRHLPRCHLQCPPSMTTHIFYTVCSRTAAGNPRNPQSQGKGSNFSSVTLCFMPMGCSNVAQSAASPYSCVSGCTDFSSTKNISNLGHQHWAPGGLSTQGNWKRVGPTTMLKWSHRICVIGRSYDMSSLQDKIMWLRNWQPCMVTVFLCAFVYDSYITIHNPIKILFYYMQI